MLKEKDRQHLLPVFFMVLFHREGFPVGMVFRRGGRQQETALGEEFSGSCALLRSAIQKKDGRSRFAASREIRNLSIKREGNGRMAPKSGSRQRRGGRDLIGQMDFAVGGAKGEDREIFSSVFCANFHCRSA